ncbi:MAG: N-methyl-L-tryptophan oxidase [Gemmatimonadaceae bacterium]
MPLSPRLSPPFLVLSARDVGDLIPNARLSLPCALSCSSSTCALRRHHPWHRRHGQCRRQPPRLTRPARPGTGPIPAGARSGLFTRPNTDHSASLFRAPQLRATAPSRLRTLARPRALARQPLLHVTGGLDIGAEGSRVFEGSLRSCREHALPHEILTATALRQRFPAYAIDEPVRAVFQPDAGFVEPERCILAHAAKARAHGAIIHEGERVLSWEASSRGVRVQTTAAEYEAEQLVISAGAWAGDLVPALAPHLTPERQALGWFDVQDHGLFAPSRFPIFILDCELGVYYGFPEHAVPGLKIGRYHHLGETVDPNRVDRETHRRDEATLRECVKSYFPAANGTLLTSKVCMFTNTVDEHFIIDRHPAHERVLLVSPCSGHGFKFCSVIGEVVADLVAQGRTDHDISLFRFERLGSLAAQGPHA